MEQPTPHPNGGPPPKLLNLNLGRGGKQQDKLASQNSCSEKQKGGGDYSRSAVFKPSGLQSPELFKITDDIKDFLFLKVIIPSIIYCVRN